MGSCISKCSSTKTPSPPPLQDKLVISQTPAPLYDFPLTNPPSSSSSSSSSSLSSSKTCSHSYSSTSSSSNEFLNNPPPHSFAKPPDPTKPYTQRPPQSPKVPLKQSGTERNQPLTAKRARSTSPPTNTNIRQKRNPPPHRAPVASPRRSNPDALRRHQENVQKELHRRKNGATSSNDVAHPWGVVKRLPSLSSTQRSSRENEATDLPHAHWIHPREGLNRRREVPFDQGCSRVPPVEDVNNPLISMECFIFL